MPQHLLPRIRPITGSLTARSSSPAIRRPRRSTVIDTTCTGALLARTARAVHPLVTYDQEYRCARAGRAAAAWPHRCTLRMRSGRPHGRAVLTSGRLGVCVPSRIMFSMDAPRSSLSTRLCRHAQGGDVLCVTCTAHGCPVPSAQRRQAHEMHLLRPDFASTAARRILSARRQVAHRRPGVDRAMHCVCRLASNAPEERVAPL